jgi:hypothetical protein
VTITDRLVELEVERAHIDEPSTALLRTIAMLREQLGQQPHFGGMAPHRWETLQLHPEGEVEWCVYCGVTR